MDNLLDIYQRYSVANIHWMLYQYKGVWYLYQTPSIPESWTRTSRQASKRGGRKALRLYIPACERYRILSDSLPLPTVTSKPANWGRYWENYLRGLYGLPERTGDNIPFYEAGDLDAGKYVVQVKAQGATIITEQTAQRLRGAV